MSHGLWTVRSWSIVLATAFLLVSEARELSLFRIDDIEPDQNTNLKRRTVHRQVAEATSLGSSTNEQTMEKLEEDTTSGNTPPGLSMGFDEEAREIAEEDEEERLHRERREMFFRNLQLDAGGTTSLSMGTSGFPTGTGQFFDMSLSMEPFFDGETRSSSTSIDLLNLRDQAYDYAETEGGFVTGETRSSELEEESTIDLIKLRAAAKKYHDENEALARESYLRNGIPYSQKQA